MKSGSVAEIPVTFISYSWSNPQHEQEVLNLAKRLVENGIDVKLDKWDLKEGQDKFAFMEQMVTNEKISKVLIICDKEYKRKADARSGGVGNETEIITPKLYSESEQEKFIPIVFEKDETNNPYLPNYIASRIYIDLCSNNENYEDEYMKLVRNIHEKPLFQKPSLGVAPDWLNKPTRNLPPILKKIIQIKKKLFYYFSKK